ncbi:MAG: glutamyl-tRNA synthetase, partial [Candidatus Berkelbacteria bacterium Athens1014_28]
MRIEDTDRQRSVEGATERIIESLNWLGISADNSSAPIIQSGRKEIYQKAAFGLVEEKKAYICTCSKEELKKEHDEQVSKGLAPKYSGRCRGKSEIRISKSETNSKSKIQNSKLPEGAVIRMKMPESGKIIIDDLIHGKVEFDPSLLDDQIILKSDGFPTYHLASVVDDHEMEISHVIRSDEWLSSTPKHLTLYKMFGWEPPKFAHLSMILGIDHSKLSKRHGATSIIDYKNDGYLPEAIVNFIALLGWNPKNDKEIFSLPELVKEFKLKNINKAAAVFDVEKLNHFNQEEIKNQKSLPRRTSMSSVESQAGKIKMTIQNIKMSEKIGQLSDGEVELVSRGGFKTLKEAAEYILKLRKDPEYDTSLLIFKKSDKEKTLRGLKAVSGQLLA